MHAWIVCAGLLFSAGPVLAGVSTEAASVVGGPLQIAADSTVTGIEGEVYIGPLRPVEKEGAANRKPYQARITVFDQTGREVAAVDSTVDGKLFIALPPGNYLLRPESPGPHARASEQQVTVAPGNVTRVEIIYDSGIR